MYTRPLLQYHRKTAQVQAVQSDIPVVTRVASMNDATFQHHFSYWWWEETWIDRQKGTLHMQTTKATVHNSPVQVDMQLTLLMWTHCHLLITLHQV